MINEEGSTVVVALTFAAAKLTEEVLKKAISSYLKQRENAPPAHGKMKLKDLMQQDQGANMMEIKSDCIKGFERIASKYNIDFAVTKDKTKDPPVYQVFFKGRDQDVLAKAFNEFVSKNEKKERQDTLPREASEAERKSRKTD